MSELSKRDRLKLVLELNGKLSDIEGGALTKRDKLKSVMRVNEILTLLGVAVNTNGDSVAKEDKKTDVVPPSGGTPTNEDPERKRTRGQRQKQNNEAVALLKKIQGGELVGDVTDAMREVLKGYSGSGGNLVNEEGESGSIYEYYTPKPIAAAMWELLGELGFSGGKVLDPSAGTGIFSQVAPDTALIDAVELDNVSGSINQLINPKSVVKVSPFEAIASRTPDDIYDAVITNVPFGSAAKRGGNAALDPKYRTKSLEYYFILRSLDKLRPSGLAAFIVPPRVVDGKDGMETDLRYFASLKAEFLGAYRLPNSVFGDAHADTITDIVVFRKHSRENADKIKGLLKENPEVLRESLVLFDDFISGRYFKTEGLRFVLGEFVAKDPNKIRDVNRVVNGGSMSDIAKLIKKFPDSRINWPLIDANPTMPITYKDGDTVSQDGTTYIMRDGQWDVLTSVKLDAEIMQFAADVSSALSAVTKKLTFEAADKFYKNSIARAAYDDIPYWLSRTMAAIANHSENAQDAVTMFDGLATGFALSEALEYHASSEPFEYLTEYKVLSDAIKTNFYYSKDVAAAIPTDMKEMVRAFKSFYNPKTNEYSVRWSGKGQKLSDLEVDQASLSTFQKYEQLKYGRNSTGATNFIPLDELKASLGADFDPYSTDDWCISPDGKGAVHRDDYFVGGYEAFLINIKAEIEDAPNQQVKDKLMRQLDISGLSVPRTDVTRLSFDMRSPFISNEDKLEFLHRYVDTRYVILVDADGKEKFFLKGASSKDAKDYAKSRFAMYINGTKSGNTGSQETTKENDPVTEAKRKAALDEMVGLAEQQFGVWVKANTSIMQALDAKANAIGNLHFKSPFNGAPLVIEGMRAEFQGKLHDYQNSAVRQYSRDFSGILAFDVGLGKTFSALATAQYVQSIGVKNKTFFILPAAVLSNWKREAEAMYTDEVMAECLFVGLRLNEKRQGPDGNPLMSYKSSVVNDDLNMILENRHKKIFMTLESFQKIPIKTETTDGYIEYMMQVDAAFKIKGKKADAVSNENLATEITNTGKKSAGIPFFEDMGVDSIIGDEFHVYKNSKDTYDFRGGKFLSKADASARGLDAQIKFWYIRDNSPHYDGVIGLSATPVTNSPLEIYSMLSLTVGEKRISDALLGVKGADAFMQSVCDISTQKEFNMLGEEIVIDVFTGLKNVSLIRGLFAGVSNIKTAEEVNLKVPEKEVTNTLVDLDATTIGKLELFKDVYSIARRSTNPYAKPQPTPQELSYLEDFCTKYGEPPELVASPFNLISKMTDLIIDDDLAAKYTKWGISDNQADVAAKVVELFNKLQVREDRSRLTTLSTEADIITTKESKLTQAQIDDGEEPTTVLVVRVKALIQNSELLLDSVDFDTQAKFLKIAEKNGLNLTVSFSPKIGAMLENFKKKEANPTGGAKSKQLIFCDNKGLHHKLKQILVQECGIPAAMIIIINGETGKDASAMQDFQDGFNSMPDLDGNDYVYRVAICNKKAEVGINLQKGTQAIHHLTTGWTPDSIHQRDGRGVRQGNKAAVVRVYMYNANGTFDEYKQMLVSKKSDWISEVLAKEGKDRLTIGGKISNKELEDLVNSIGDKDAIRKAKERIEESAKAQVIELAKLRQTQALKIIDTQKDYLENKLTLKAFLRGFMISVIGTYENYRVFEKNANNEKVSENFRARNAAKAAEIAPKLEKYRKMASEGLNPNGYYEDIDAWWSSYVTYVNRQGNKSSIADFAKYELNQAVIVEDSDLWQDWQSNISLANNMIEQAIKAFKDETEGYDSKGVEDYAKGKGVVINGKMITDLTIIYKANDIESMRVITIEDSNVKLNKAAIKPARWTYIEKTSPQIEAFAESMAELIVVTPFDAGYNAAVMLLAKHQDLAVSNGVAASGSGDDTFFSDLIPDVAKYTTTKAKVFYDFEDYLLPSPYFKFVFAKIDDSLRRISQSIYDAQEKLIAWNPNNRTMFSLKDDSIELVKAPSDMYGSYNLRCFDSLLEYAMLESGFFKLSDMLAATKVSDIYAASVLLPLFTASIDKYLKANGAGLAFDTLEEAYIFWQNILVEEYPYLDLYEVSETLDDKDIQGTMMRVMAPIIKDLAYMLPAKTEVQDGFDKAQQLAQNGIVSLKGPSYNSTILQPIKETVKSISSQYGNKKALWHNNSKTWVVPLEAYIKLFDIYPDIMKQVLVLAPAVYSLRAG